MQHHRTIKSHPRPDVAGRLFRIAALLLAPACLWAQTTEREAYREAFQSWRGMDPLIEQDTSPRPAIAPRTQQLAAAVAAFTAAKQEFLEARTAADQGLQQQVPPSPEDLDPVANPATLENLMDRLSSTLSRMISGYADTNDAQLVRLRTALEDEQAALEAVRQATQARAARSAAAADALVTIETQRASVETEIARLTATSSNAAEVLQQEAEAWKEYYALLGGGQSGSETPGPAQTTSSDPSAAAPPAAVATSPTIAPVPLGRYTGRWMFPVGGMFFGSQPAAIGLEVSEANGMVTGSFAGTFRLPQDSAGDPELSFTFQGPLQADRTQSFPLTTPEGLTGTIQLIPGPAFNLLEVNFETSAAEGKVTNGNFLLLKE